jgi:hypothetical protein
LNLNGNQGGDGPERGNPPNIATDIRSSPHSTIVVTDQRSHLGAMVGGLAVYHRKQAVLLNNRILDNQYNQSTIHVNLDE